MKGRSGPIAWRTAPLGLLAVFFVVLTASAALAQPAADPGDETTAGTDAAVSPDPYTLISEASDASADRAYSGREQVMVMAGGVAHWQQVPVSHPAGEPTSALLPSGGPLVTALTSRFLPVFAGTTTMAGRPAYRVELMARTGQRVATLWVDVKTCLPLGRTLYDGAGAVVRSSNYLAVQVAPLRKAAAPGRPASATGSLPTAAGLATLRAQGWAVPEQLSTGLTLFDVRTSGTGTGQVVHLSYTDGLTALSVFEQRGRLAHAGMRGWASRPLGGTTVWTWPAAPDQVSWAAAGRVFTVVSDDPGRLGSAVSGLPHQPDRGSPGVVDRFRHGLHRIWGWVNPF